MAQCHRQQAFGVKLKKGWRLPRRPAEVLSKAVKYTACHSVVVSRSGQHPTKRTGDAHTPLQKCSGSMGGEVNLCHMSIRQYTAHRWHGFRQASPLEMVSVGNGIYNKTSRSSCGGQRDVVCKTRCTAFLSASTRAGQQSIVQDKVPSLQLRNIFATLISLAR